MIPGDLPVWMQVNICLEAAYECKRKGYNDETVDLLLGNAEKLLLTCSTTETLQIKEKTNFDDTVKAINGSSTLLGTGVDNIVDTLKGSVAKAVNTLTHALPFMTEKVQEIVNSLNPFNSSKLFQKGGKKLSEKKRLRIIKDILDGLGLESVAIGKLNEELSRDKIALAKLTTLEKELSAENFNLKTAKTSLGMITAELKTAKGEHEKALVKKKAEQDRLVENQKIATGLLEGTGRLQIQEKERQIKSLEKTAIEVAAKSGSPTLEAELQTKLQEANAVITAANARITALEGEIGKKDAIAAEQLKITDADKERLQKIIETLTEAAKSSAEELRNAKILAESSGTLISKIEELNSKITELEGLKTTLETEKTALVTERDNLVTEKATLQSQVDSPDETTLKEAIRLKDEAIQSKETAIREKDEAIREKDKANQTIKSSVRIALQKEIEALKAIVKEKNEAIGAHLNELGDGFSENSTVSDVIKKLKSDHEIEIGTSKTRFSELQIAHDKFKRDLESAEQTIQALQNAARPSPNDSDFVTELPEPIPTFEPEAIPTFEPETSVPVPDDSVKELSAEEEMNAIVDKLKQLNPDINGTDTKLFFNGTGGIGLETQEDPDKTSTKDPERVFFIRKVAGSNDWMPIIDGSVVNLANMKAVRTSTIEGANNLRKAYLNKLQNLYRAPLSSIEKQTSVTPSFISHNNLVSYNILKTYTAGELEKYANDNLDIFHGKVSEIDVMALKQLVWLFDNDERGTKKGTCMLIGNQTDKFYEKTYAEWNKMGGFIYFFEARNEFAKIDSSAGFNYNRMYTIQNIIRKTLEDVDVN